MSIDLPGAQRTGEFLLGLQYRPWGPLGSGTHEAAPPRVPPTLFAERYQLEELISESWEGSVYRATDLRREQRVNLRIIPKSRFDSDCAVAEFARLAQDYMETTPPSFTRVFGVGELGDCCFIAIEHVVGSPVVSPARPEPAEAFAYSISRALQIACAVFAAVGEAQCASLPVELHSDHALIDAEGRVRVRNGAILRPRLKSRLNGESVKTAGRWGAAECATSRALGECLYFLLADEFPHPLSSSIASIRPGIPKALDRLVTRLLNPNAASRTRIPRAVRELCAIESRLRTSPGSVSVELDQRPITFLPNGAVKSPKLQPERGERKAAPRAVLLGCLIIALFASGFLMRPRPPHDRETSANRKMPSLKQPDNPKVSPTPSKHFGPDFTIVDAGIFTFSANVTSQRAPWEGLTLPADIASLDFADASQRLISGDSGVEIPPAPVYEPVIVHPQPASDTTSALEADGIAPIEHAEVFGRKSLLELEDNLVSLPGPSDFWSYVPFESPMNLIPWLAVTHTAQKEVIIPARPTARIGDLNLSSVFSSDRKGILLRFPVQISHAQGQSVEIGAYFYTDGGRRVIDLNGEYRSSGGYVYAKKVISINTDEFDDGQFALYLPFVEIDGVDGGIHRLSTQVYAWSGPNYDRQMGKGAREAFSLRLFRFNAVSR